jgi:hypothetical protein
MKKDIIKAMIDYVRENAVIAEGDEDKEGGKIDMIDGERFDV